MIYVLCLSIILVSGLIGDAVAKTFVLRDEFLKELINMATYFKNNIVFRKTKLNDLFLEYLNNVESKFKPQLQSLNNLIEKDEELNFRNKCLYLKSEDFNLIISFFKDLGAFSQTIEVEKFDNFIGVLKQKSAEAWETRKRNAGLTYKVCIAVGVVFSILII